MIDILRSEWTKIRSVRSTMWTLVSALVLMVVLGAVICLAVANNPAGNVPVQGDEGLGLSMMALPFASLAMATLGVLVISSEYRTGMIRTSLQAVPQRLTLLFGKVIVFTVVTLVFSLVTVFAAFFVGQAMLATVGLDTSIGGPEVLRALFGNALMLTASGLFGLALGSLIRHTPGAMVAAISLILVLPSLTSVLPGEWGRVVARYFTTNAGLQVTKTVVGEGALGPWPGFGVYLVWIAVVLVAGAFLLRRRDA
ncbi:ABC transporter permease subunit [Nonomuraea sp. NBC_01738]|uniref:ABC transporter permease subunit n=1 Tax=Nonomuraea sp. NBC_01738 TaxID=2976003 RepID=UPI002E12ADF1|nr:ABC transporter permease subunit [Nonomuraea sp. NBC_01738]